ncbi:unnamed protein product [Phytophthora fragariaefolia]|uniref:Unnamed protein product n=1 Tax=Phytophthora fragariaefolia TaxID=1490495 RepID=A0A9W7CV07_9STRA|nr:unnamed protein product [Phytophthora fragariaefolia]
MLTQTLSTTAYSGTTSSLDSNLGAPAEVNRRTDAECPTSTRNGTACWTVRDVSGRIAEPEAVLDLQRTVPTSSQRSEHFAQDFQVKRWNRDEEIIPKSRERSDLSESEHTFHLLKSSRC